MFTISSNHFIDSQGRSVHLRGVNLGGSTKVPYGPKGATHHPDSLREPENASFVGRPFPLEEADEHFARLKAWGLTFLRLLITWEAVEHAGPEVYDEAYLDYLAEIVRKAGEHGLCLFIDPHQDTWSRFSGGDGAPAWTFDCLGMDVTRFHAAGAAMLHAESGAAYRRMCWTTNYGRYACATLFTLFFGGDAFAPGVTVDGQPVQAFLQGHYINAVRQVAERLREFPHVLGYDTLNEPNPGYIGCPDLRRIGAEKAANGPVPSLYQGMLLAAGYPQDVKVKPNGALPPLGSTRLNARGISVWRDGREELWKGLGVWGTDPRGEPRLLRPAYFAQIDGRPVDFDRDCLAPFVRRYAAAIRAADPGAVIFVSPAPGEVRFGEESLALPDLPGIAYAPHWYDGITLSFQRYLRWVGVDTTQTKMRFAFGRGKRRALFREVMRRFASRSRERFGQAPVVIGETGIPFNLEKGRAYHDGDFAQQVAALDDVMQALESTGVDFTLWDYTADNTNQYGDQWNGEDLSIFSRDQRQLEAGIHAGGRALAAAIRPYAARVPGEALEQSFDLSTGVYRLRFHADPTIQAPLEVFVPQYHYAAGAIVIAPHGRVELDLNAQRLEYWPAAGQPVHEVMIMKE